MTLSICEHPHSAPADSATTGQPDRLTGIALMTGSAASNQLGAATAALAFPALGPAGVVAVRQWVAGVLLLAAARPKFASFTREQWRPVLALALIFATMNLSLYAAVAAPSWLDAALPVISATPVSRPDRTVAAPLAGAAGGHVRVERVMAGACASQTHTQNA